MTPTDAELRKALDTMRIWISEDAHLGESTISYELEKAEGLRKLDAIEQAIAATVGDGEGGRDEWRSVALGLFDSLEKADLEVAQRWLCENDLLRQEIAYGDAKAATAGVAREEVATREQESIVCDFLRKISPERNWMYLGEVEHALISEMVRAIAATVGDKPKDNPRNYNPDGTPKIPNMNVGADPDWVDWVASLEHKEPLDLKEVVEQFMFEVICFGGEMGPNDCGGEYCPDEGMVYTNDFIDGWVRRIAATAGRPKVKKVRGMTYDEHGGEVYYLACSGCGEWIGGDLDCITEYDGPNFCHNCGGEFDGPLLCKRCGGLADLEYGDMCAECYEEVGA